MSGQAMPLHYYIDISVSDDKLSAFLRLTNCDETFAVTRQQLDELLLKHHIVFGLKEDTLHEIVREPKLYFNKSIQIASGQLPVNGKDGHVKYAYDLENNTKKPVELDDGTVDYKEVASIHNVRKGQLIAERFPPSPGIPGRAVTGEMLPAQDGREARFHIGKNVVLDAEGHGLYAAIDGMITKTDREKINVFPIYEVNGDVDYHIGNISFVGNVVIRGNVLPGFRIRTEGDIRITGSVDAADIEAGGSIEISAGILGGNKGTVRAGKSVKCSFIQDAVVEAGEDVLVSQSIMHSHVKAGRSVVCKGTKGLIVGGTVQAGELVSARTIGNTMSTATAIEVGVLPELRNELQDLRSSLKNLTLTSDKTDKALVLLDQLAAAGQLSADKVAMRIKLNHSKKQVMEDLVTVKERILEIEKALDHTDLAYVEANSVVYGGTKIVIGRSTKFVKESFPRVRFILSEGDISASPLL